MKCVVCTSKTKVVESRDYKRRRECLSCGYRFNTVEVEATGEGSHPSSGTRNKPLVRKARAKKVQATSKEVVPAPAVEPSPFHVADQRKTKAGVIEDLREDRALQKLESDWYGD